MSASSQPIQKNLLPFQQQQVASNQQRPLAYCRGTRLMAVGWMTPALNERTYPSKSTGKKG